MKKKRFSHLLWFSKHFLVDRTITVMEGDVGGDVFVAGTASLMNKHELNRNN